MAPKIVYQVEGQQVEVSLDPGGKEELIIGRAQDSDVVVKHASISRRHARLFREGDSWKVEDLGSKNGTRVNTLDHTDHLLVNGDRIFLHEIPLTFTDDEGPAAAAVPALATLAEDATSPASQTVYRSAVDFASLVSSRPDSPAAAASVAERMQRLVTIVTAASEAILVSKSLDETFQKVLTMVFEHLPVQRGFIMLWDEKREDLVTQAVKHKLGSAETEIKFSRTIAEKVYRDRIAVLTLDAQLDDRFSAGESIAAMGIRSAMAAPLWNGEKVDGLIYVDTSLQSKAFDNFDLDLLSALGNHVAVAIEQARLQRFVVEKEKLDRELAVAREIQMGILPQKMPSFPGFDIAGSSVPADETGGDTFDVFTIDEDRLILLLGDATGHGIGPALSVTQVRSMLRIAMRLGADLDAAFTQINDQLAHDLADNRFVTAFLGILDRSDHRVRYHAGGQGPLMHFHAAEGRFDWHGASTVPMGFMPTIGLKPAQCIELAPGDILGLMTDGVFEAEDTEDEQFGEKRVEALVQEHHAGSMSKLLDSILKRVHKHSTGRPQADDITVLLVRRSGEG